MSKNSLPPSYFEGLYAADIDPWKFATSEYEREKYAATLEALPQPRFASVFEVGCSIGILTRQLADRCDKLLAVDVAEAALVEAKARCVDMPQVKFKRRCVPNDWPEQETFDLILFSEVLYYLCTDDIRATAERTVGSLAPNGTVLLVHFTGETNYPCTAAEAVSVFTQATNSLLNCDLSYRRDLYRVDRFRRA